MNHARASNVRHVAPFAVNGRPRLMRQARDTLRVLSVITRWALLVALFGAAVGPYALMVVGSLQTGIGIQVHPGILSDAGAQWQNYREAWGQLQFGRMLLVSVLAATTITIAQTCSATVTAFALARARFAGRRLAMGAFLSSLLVPAPLTWLPAFAIIHALGLVDTYWSLVLPFVVGPTSTLLVFTYLGSIPRDLEDSAIVDGSGAWGLLRFVIVPLAAPMLRIVACLTFLFAWSELFWPLLVTQSSTLRTLPVGLTYFQGEIDTQWQLLMAGGVLTTIPPILVAGLLLRGLARPPLTR